MQEHGQAAFDAERAEWERNGEFDRVSELVEDAEGAVLDEPAVEVPEGSEVVEAPFGGNVWKLLVKKGDTVEEGQTIAVIEAMKMECPLESPAAGTISALYIEEAQNITPGAPLLALEAEA